MRIGVRESFYMHMDARWLRRMRSGERRALGAVLRTLVAEDEAILSRTEPDRVAARLQAQLDRLPLILALAFRLALTAIEWGPLLSPRYLRRFSRLSLAVRLRRLEGWEFSRLFLKRDLFKLIKLTALANMLQEPELLCFIGYEDTLRHRGNTVENGRTPCPKATRP